jgi:hypothetical protein
MSDTQNQGSGYPGWTVEEVAAARKRKSTPAATVAPAATEAATSTDARSIVAGLAALLAGLAVLVVLLGGCGAHVDSAAQVAAKCRAWATQADPAGPSDYGAPVSWGDLVDSCVSDVSNGNPPEGYGAP